MKFLERVKASVYNPVYYQTEVAEERGKRALGYYALILVIATLLMALPVMAALGSFLGSPDKRALYRETALEIFPQELILTFSNGRLSTNVSEPYFIPVPERGKNGGQDTPKNLLVIDTQKPISADDFKTYDTFAIASESSIGVYNAEQNKIEIQDISGFVGTETLDKKRYTDLVLWAERLLTGIGWAFLLALPLFVYIGLFVWYLFYLLFGALVIWLIARLCKVRWNFGQSYKAGLHLITLPLAYDILLALLPGQGLRVSFLFTALLAILAYLNLRKFSQLPATVATASATLAPMASDKRPLSQSQTPIVLGADRTPEDN